MSSESVIVIVDRDLEDLIPGFKERRRKDVVNLRSSLAAGDMENIRITGHSMKGTGGSYGFDEISTIGAALESAAMGGQDARISEIIDHLESYLERVEIRFE